MALPDYTTQDPATYKAAIDAAIAALADKGALVYRNTDQSISTSSSTTLNWDLEDYDTDSIHDTVTNNSRLTVPTGVTRVRAYGLAIWQAHSSGYRHVRILKNGATTYNGLGAQTSNSNAGSAEHNMQVSTAIIDVVAGDYFEMSAYQTSGSTLNIEGGVNHSWFAMEIIK